MSEFIAANGAIIEQRWPDLCAALNAAPEYNAEQLQLVNGQQSTVSIDGIQLTSRHQRRREAEVIASRIPEHARHAHVYGVGLGDVQQVLLQRPALASLTVHILNESVLMLVLMLTDQQHWLTDERVTLQLAHQHTDLCLPFACYPSELQLASAANRKISERIISELDTQFVNQRVDDSAQQRTDQNNQLAERLNNTSPVDALFNQLPASRPVFVLGTGPTLAHHYDYLKQAQQRTEPPLLIAVDTAYRPLTENGVVPDIVITLDQHISLRHFPAVEHHSAAIKLVFFPVSQSAVLNAWQGPLYVANGDAPMFAKLPHQPACSQLFVYGSVLHPALDLAVRTGSHHVVLFGADFAFPGGKTHSGWDQDKLGVSQPQEQEWTLNGHGEKVATQRNFRSYLIGVERFIARHPDVTFYNTSRAGAYIEGTHWYSEVTG